MAEQPIELSNQQARHLWLHIQGLLLAPTSGKTGKQAIMSTVRHLGMVQLDSVPNIVRAHHHILWSRHTGYREHHYNELLGHSPEVFEHFSHDAAILPLELYPYWHRQHLRRSRAFTHGTLGEQLPDAKVRRQLLASIRSQGPMCSRDFSAIYTTPADKSRHAWMRPPHKQALEYLWLKGDLCVSHRQVFTKYYDLAERIIPTLSKQAPLDVNAQIDALCTSALHRLGFGSARNIQAFYDACTLDEVKLWLKRFPNKHRAITIQTFNGDTLELIARVDIEDVLDNLPPPTRQMRIVNPFDPVVRDRLKLHWLFGMDYKIEIYVPAAKRRYGYYVYPLIENAKTIGRIDVTAHRQENALVVKNWWLEPGVKNSKSRTERLQSELRRLAKLANVQYDEKIPNPIVLRSED